MKRYIGILFLLLYFVVNHTLAQNYIKGYEYWFDNDYSSGITTSVSPVENFELSTAVPTSDLNDGLHILNIRFWDDSLRYSSPLSRFFFIKPDQMVVNKEIVVWQYWFDNDFENAITQDISPAQQYNVLEDFDVNDLTSGIHMVHVRFKDNTQTWSTSISQFFFKKPEQTVVNKEIVAYQFWYDNNFEEAVTQNITPAQQFNLMNDFDVNNLTSGIHMFHFRVKDNTDTWSSTISQFFFIKPAQTVVNKEIVSLQYWFDEDFENAFSQDITPEQQFNLMDNLDVNGLTTGIHRIYFRFKDNADSWSIVLSQFFYKKETTNLSDNEMGAYRYWFDDDFESVIEEQFGPTESGLNLLSNLDMTQIWKGGHTVHFQFIDMYNQWSIVTTDSVTKNSLPIASFEYTSQIYCDSTIVNMVNNSIDGDEYLWDFGDGNTSVDFEPIHTYYEPGDYSVSLTITDTILAIDSTITEMITVISNVTYATINPVECDTYDSPSGNYTLNSSGTYMDTIPNIMGCDSVITIELTILNSSFAMVTETACDSYNSPSGLYTWTSSGTFMDTIPNVAGCDSIITVDLTVFNSTFATITETACDNYTSPSGLYSWTSSGTFIDTIPNVAGCDSVITVDLTIHYSSTTTLTETACFSYISPSGNYTWTISGSYMDTIPTVMGCDSILSIDLTINTVDTTVSLIDNTLTANAIDAAYQWIDCENMLPIEGETNQSFTPMVTGFYAVEVTQNNCVDTSSCYQVVISGFEEIDFVSDFTVYPNPTNGFISIDLGEVHESFVVKVFDYQGQLVETNQFGSTEKVNLEIKGAKGLYFIDVKTAKGKSAIFKVLKE